MRTSPGDAALPASLFEIPWTGESAVANLDVATGTTVGLDSHPIAAKIAVKKSTFRSNDFFEGVDFIGFGALTSATVLRATKEGAEIIRPL